MTWEVVVLDYVADWIAGLPIGQREVVMEALCRLSELGPTLGRPYVDHLKGSRLNNLKELRPRGTTLRLIFLFDSSRRAVILAAGDKRNQWKSWYRKQIPIAEFKYREYTTRQDRGVV